MATQKSQILEYMDAFGSITTMEAFSDLGITKLTTRISELRKDGHDIRSETVHSRNRLGKNIYYYRYYLCEEESA